MFSSPGLYLRKKLAGRESRRIIMEASTPREVLAFSRVWIIPLTLPISRLESSTHTMQIAMASSASVRPLVSTGPVSVRVIWGMSSPTSVTASVPAAIITASLRVTQRFMYSKRSGMPSFICGSGR